MLGKIQPPFFPRVFGPGADKPLDDAEVRLRFEALAREIAAATGETRSPEEVAEQMLQLHQATGINHLIMSVQWPGMPQGLVLDQLHRLAEEVFPLVRHG
jgi:N-methylhydantoinase A/oxoprolinase/acetone carboxylase beta subunit